MLYFALIIVTSLLVFVLKMYVEYQLPELKHKTWNLNDIEEYPEIHKKVKNVIYGLLLAFVVSFLAITFNIYS